MKNNVPVSVIISAFNEEKKLEECLASVSWADEIIVIDNSSTDRTSEIAKKYTDKIFVKQNNLMLNVNKNFGFTKAVNDWVLSLDADERVTPELAKEIVIAIQDDTKEGYWIPRKNIIFGKWIQNSGWYPDYVLRLFKKNKGRFEEKHVHEMIKISGETEYLTHPLEHLNYESIAQFLHKTIVIYAPNEATQKLESGYTFHYLDAIRFPVSEFLSRFFAREGYKDGFHGLMLSILMAVYHFIVFAHIWEMKGFRQMKDVNILEKTEEAFLKSHKDVMFWFYNEKIKDAKSFFKKSMYKLKRKLP